MGWISGACQLPYAAVRTDGTPADGRRDEHERLDEHDHEHEDDE
ncbi:hypothetical protein LY13_003036 [Prauserella aidingensis]|nr:hypothetical protein [Prauserella aidingensis]MCP2254269.1 hypothetical protein [Prauserella aidingensis]